MMNAATVKFLALYIIVIIITDMTTWRLGIPLIWRIVFAFAVTAIFLLLKYLLDIKDDEDNHQS